MQIFFILHHTYNISALTFLFTLFMWNLRWADSPSRCCRSLTYLATEMLHVTSLKTSCLMKLCVGVTKSPPPRLSNTLFM